MVTMVEITAALKKKRNLMTIECFLSIEE